MMRPPLKEHVKGTVSFEYFQAGELWYRTSDTRLLFPVPVADTQTTRFPATDKSMMFMRWIRQYLQSAS